MSDPRTGSLLRLIRDEPSDRGEGMNRCFWEKISRRALSTIYHTAIGLLAVVVASALFVGFIYLMDNNVMFTAIVQLLVHLVVLYLLVGIPVGFMYGIYTDIKNAIRETIEECKE